MRRAFTLVVSIALSTFHSQAGDAPRAARSVHLAYPAPNATVFYNEATVELSTPGTYFCACGFSRGYFGIQELGSKEKVVIFSVWEPPHGDAQEKVPEEQRVKELFIGEDVRGSRFSNEGTGGKSMFTYTWRNGETYRFAVKAWADGERTAYAGYFFIPETKQWKHLATFSTLAKGDLLKGYYSFVEDFRRDGASVNEIRRARYGNGWVKSVDGPWVALTRAKFTADKTPLETIDAGVVGDGFFLTTGGDVKNVTPLNNFMDRPPTVPSLPN